MKTISKEKSKEKKKYKDLHNFSFSIIAVCTEIAFVLLVSAVYLFGNIESFANQFRILNIAEQITSSGLTVLFLGIIAGLFTDVTIKYNLKKSGGDE